MPGRRRTVVATLLFLWVALDSIIVRAQGPEREVKECVVALEKCDAERDRLTGSAAECQSAREKLRSEVERLNQMVGKLQQDFQVCNTERMLPEQKRALEEDIAKMHVARATLVKEGVGLRGEAQKLTAERAALIARIEELVGLRGVLEKPQLAERAKMLLSLLTGERAPETVEYTEGGRRHLLTNLVLGTLRVSYEAEIAAGRATPLTLEFEPHSVLSREVFGAFVPKEVITNWYVRVEYQPARINAKYDFDQSGQKGRERKVDVWTNQREHWVWAASADHGFEVDKSYVIFYLGVETGEGKKLESDVWREQIVWRERQVPGWMSQIWEVMKGWFAWMLGTVAAFATIWAGWETVVVRRLERNLRGLELKLQQARVSRQ